MFVNIEDDKRSDSMFRKFKQCFLNKEVGIPSLLENQVIICELDKPYNSKIDFSKNLGYLTTSDVPNVGKM